MPIASPNVSVFFYEKFFLFFLFPILLKFLFQTLFVQKDLTLIKRSILAFCHFAILPFCFVFWRMLLGGDIGEWCIFFSYQTSKSARIKSIFYKIGLNFYILGTFKADNTATSLFSSDILLIKFCMNLSDFFFGNILSTALPYFVFCLGPAFRVEFKYERKTNKYVPHSSSSFESKRKENSNAKAKTYGSSVCRHQLSVKSLLNKTLRPDLLSKENKFK